MANVDRANGFILVGSMGGYMPEGRWYKVWGEVGDTSDAIAAGDMTVIDTSDPGYVTVATAAANVALLGLALASTTGGLEEVEDILIADDPNAVFQGQCEDTPTQALILTSVEIDGTTGIMEIDSSVSSHAVITLLELVDRPDNIMDEHADMLFKIQRHVLASSTVEGG